MIKTLKIAIQIMGAVAFVTIGTSIGALYGWEHHGWAGAIALGFVGFVVGALVASSPSILLEFLQ